MTEFKDRFKKLRSEKGISQEELGKFFGVGKQAVSSWENGNSMPRPETLNKLADFFGVSIDYLLARTDDPGPMVLEKNSDYRLEDNRHGVGYIQVKDNVGNGGTTISDLRKIIRDIENKDKYASPIRIDYVPTKRVPIIGRIPAGRSSYAEEDVEGWMIIPAELNADYLLRVHGDSMIGADIEQGDLVACRQVHNYAVPGEIVVANINGDEATLKYLLYENNTWKLRAANSDYPDVILNEDEDRIIAVVEGIVKKPKEADPLDTRINELVKKMSHKKKERILGLLEVMRDDED